MAEVENVVQAASAASPVADAQPGMQPAPLTLDQEGQPISPRALGIMDPADFLVAYLRSMAAGVLPPAQVHAAVEAIQAAADAAERIDETLIRASMPCTDADGNLTPRLLESGILPASSGLLEPAFCTRCRGKVVSEERPATGAFSGPFDDLADALERRRRGSDTGAKGDDEENCAEEPGEPAKG